MKCPFCGHENTRVIDSRPSDENNSIRRRRVCDECGKRFTTYEKIETIPLVVIKKDNNREPYDRSKIEAGGMRACHKRRVSVNEITPEGVKYTDKDGSEQFAKADLVLYACGNRANSDVVESLRGCCDWFVVTGDAKQARMVKQATYEGFCAAMDII